MTGRNTYLVGIDGGGTGCRVAIAAPDGQVLARVIGGPANATDDAAATGARLCAVLEQARALAGISAADLRAAHAHVGLAGVMDESHRAPLKSALPMAALCVTDDRPTTLAGALRGAPGGVAALGTGSFIAHAGAGQAPRFAGGWGSAVGDQSSGAWLGRSALTQAVLAGEGIVPPAPFLAGILAEFGGTPRAISTFSETASPADFGRFAPAVIGAATAGDSAARALIQSGVGYISAALSALGHNPGAPLCLTGGLGPHYAPFLPDGLRAGLVPAKGSALDGALLLAAKMADAPAGQP